MKSRIGKLEGDGRTSKRLQESLGKHVKILENALRKEREKVKALQSGQASEEKKEGGESPQEGGKIAKRMPQINYQKSRLTFASSGNIETSEFFS